MPLLSYIGNWLECSKFRGIEIWGMENATIPGTERRCQNGIVGPPEIIRQHFRGDDL